jgi:hypothetical protein
MVVIDPHGDNTARAVPVAETGEKAIWKAISIGWGYVE